MEATWTASVGLRACHAEAALPACPQSLIGFVDMCIDMYIDVRIDMYIDMRANMCSDMCADVSADMCTDMCASMRHKLPTVLMSTGRSVPTR